MTPTITPPPVDPIGAEEIVRLREVAQAATPGPWRTTYLDEGVVEIETPDGAHIAVADGLPADATHIATFDPPTVQRILDALDKARAEVERLRRGAAALDRYRELALKDSVAWRDQAARAEAERDAARAVIERVRALATDITPEMQTLADKGRFRALWVNLRTDLRAALDGGEGA